MLTERADAGNRKNAVILRRICSNSLIFERTDLCHPSLRHAGLEPEQLVQRSLGLAALGELVQTFGSRVLNARESMSFAQTAISGRQRDALRYCPPFENETRPNRFTPDDDMRE